jgi:glycosyltransferase involved in cell wall biosynthesis
MKIAVYHNQPSGGARRALHGFCAELSKRHRLDLYTLETADETMLRDDDVAERVVRLPFSLRPAVRMGLYLNDLRRWQDVTSLRQVTALAASSIDSGDYDVVLVDACRFTYAPQVLSFLRTPSAYYCHHRPRHRHEEPAKPPRSAYWYAHELWHRPFERRLQRRLWMEDYTAVLAADRVVTNSEFNAKRLREVYAVEAAVCPPGIDLPARPSVTSGAHLLGVGAVESHKGFDFLIEATALLPERSRPPLHIAANDGNPYLRSQLEKLAQAKGVRLEIQVGQSQAQLEAEYAGALAFLWASHMEPLGLAPLEALARSIPVVAVAEGGVLETVEDARTGYLVSRDPAQFADRVRRLLDSPGLRRSFGASGRAYVEASWSRAARATALENELFALARNRSQGLSAAG